MNLLPKSSKEFNSKQYWDKFFSKRGTKSFEWYGEYTELCGILQKYIKPPDKILVAGCGSSSISANLFNSGYRQITNIDLSEIVIKQMKTKYDTSCKEMKWIQGDLFNLPFDSDSFSCILDKGTLDALMSENTDQALSKSNDYFQELARVMRLGGRYICISLLQEHILSSILNWFPLNGWFLRFCRCEDAEKAQAEDRAFCFPVFVIVCTKFKLMDNFKSVIELNLHEGKPERVGVEEVREAVLSCQQFALLRHNLSTKSVSEEEVVVDLYDQKTGLKRYTLFIVDAPRIKNQRPFAVFIVPHGREIEWLFKTKNGQIQLAESASSNRLVVVHLIRYQVYGGMQDVKDDLAAKVLDLAPSKLPPNYKIPFLSVGDGIGERKEVFRGKSHFSGEFIVEDVKDEVINCVLRRLIFLQNQNLIQSEAKFLYNQQRKKKGGKASARQQELILDRSYLACAHHTVMVASLELVCPRPSSLLLVGLGGGALASYIHKYFPKVSVTAVDIDEEIVDVAKKWFLFEPDSRLKCEVEDGLSFIKDALHKGIKYDIILFDVDSKEVSEGLSCPPKDFLEKSFLDQVLQCLTEEGLFTLNLVCRDKILRKEIQQELKKVFPTVISVSIPEEVNVVLFCRRTASMISKETFEQKMISLNKYLQSRVNTKQDVLDLSDMVKNFQVL